MEGASLFLAEAAGLASLLLTLCLSAAFHTRHSGFRVLFCVCLLAVPHGMWDLSSQPRTEPGPAEPGESLKFRLKGPRLPADLNGLVYLHLPGPSHPSFIFFFFHFFFLRERVEGEKC